jgi:hypothetical protein
VILALSSLDKLDERSLMQLIRGVRYDSYLPFSSGDH